MDLSYIYIKGEKYLVGYFDDYPEYPTQGIDIKELEKNLLEIYSLIIDGTLDMKKYTRGILRINV
jgi:predicted RNase H-like HicB family nuclease